MGLKMTLSKEKNSMYYDFIDAYWAIDDLLYSTDGIMFRLRCYPSRESKVLQNTILQNNSIGYGSGGYTVNSSLYEWHVTMSLREIFPTGVIPAGKDAQYTAIYNWIKSYTELPFEDVFEEDQNS